MNPSNEKIRYIFDISSISLHVSKSATYSGIQRVVAMLIPCFFKVIPEEMKSEVYFGVYDRKSGRYRCGLLFDIVDSMQNPEELAIRFNTPKLRGAAFRQRLKPLDKYQDSLLKFYFHRARFDFHYLLGKDGHFLRKNTTREEWRAARWPKSQPQEKITVPMMVDIDQIARPGDVVVLLDSSWSPSMNTIFQDLAKRRLIIHVMVYDLISLSAPGYVVKSLAQTFALWLKQSVGYAHSYITISQNVREEMESFLRHSGADQSVWALPLVQSFPPDVGPTPSAGPLADMLGPSAYPLFGEGLAFEDNLRALGQRSFVLCAGTIEIRKNPIRLAQAWLRLVERTDGDLPKLVFAGKMGWMVDDFRELMKATGNMYGYIEIIEGPTDRELQFLYRHCLFLAMPSLYEGWGLPVGEALSFGKTAIVSNCSSLPEVGQDLVEYCDPTSVRSIADAAWRLLENPNRRMALEAKIAKTDLRTWDDVARDLRDILLSDH